MLPSPDLLQRLLNESRYEEAFDALLPAVSDKVSTRLNVLSGWRVYARWLEESHCSLLNVHQPEVDFITWLESQYDAPSTVNNRLYQVRKLYDFLVELELVTHNPFGNSVGQYNPFTERREVYSAEEIGRLLAHANAEEKLLLLLATEGGLSAREVAALRFEDLLQDGEELRVTRVRYRKGGFNPEQVVGTTTSLRQALQQWLATHGAAPLYSISPQGFIFQEEGQPLTSRQLLSKLHALCQKANVTYKPWRALKHAAGVQKLAAGQSKTDVQKTLSVERLDPLAKKAGIEDGRKKMWKEGGKRRR